MEMKAQHSTDVDFELRKMVVKYSPLFDQYQWAAESMRWVELAFSLVTQISNRPKEEIRRIIEEINLLGLLEIKPLAGLGSSHDGIDYDSSHARRLGQCLTERGFTQEETRNIIIVLFEAARAIEQDFGGKIQCYLRKYGQLMLSEMLNYFHFSQLSPDSAKFAFSYWLQNVLAMPIPLKTPAVICFCERLGISEEQFMDEVDEADLNLALVDDMIELNEGDRNKSDR